MNTLLLPSPSQLLPVRIMMHTHNILNIASLITRSQDLGIGVSEW